MKTQPQTPEILPYSTCIPLTTKVKKFLEELDSQLENQFLTDSERFGINQVKISADIWFREEIKAIKNNQI